MVWQMALRALPAIGRGALQGGKALFGPAKNFPGGLVGQEAAKAMLVAPVLGAAAHRVGLPWGYHAAPAAAPAMVPNPGMAPGMAPGAQGMMTQGQFEQMYGKQGWSAPWQEQEGFYEKQARESRGLQRDLANTYADVSRYQSDTQRYRSGLDYNLGMDTNQTRIRMADLQTGRDLEGLKNTNQSRIRMAEIDANTRINAIYDTNRRDVRIADYDRIARMHDSDRSVERARWGGSMDRISGFGRLMR